MRRKKGFTLLEILISAVLIIIGVGFIGFTVVSVRRFFKDNEDRARAMRLASSKIEELLAKGYSGLNDNSFLYEDSGLFWKVSTETATGTKAEIPYKKVEAVASYTADRGKGRIDSVKKVRLTNIISYPLVHTKTVDVNENEDIDNCSDCFVPPDNGSSSGDPDAAQYKTVKGNGNLEIEFDYKVEKDIKAAYTISVISRDKSSPDDLDSLDTIYSTFFFDGQKMFDCATARTPIISQPTFNLIEVNKKVLPGRHTISVGWVKRTENGSSANSAGDIWLVSGTLTIIAIER